MPPFQLDELKPTPTPPKSHVLGVVLLFLLAVVMVVIYRLVLVPLLMPPNLLKPEAHAGVGKRVAFLELRPLTGDPPPISLRDLENHVTLLNLWGTWCPPCRSEVPHMAELRKRFADQEAFRLVAVSCPAGGQPEDVQSLQEETARLLKSLKLDMPTYYDPDNATQEALGSAIALDGFPTTVLFDNHGVIRAVWVGYRPGLETEMERYIGSLLDDGTVPVDAHGGEKAAGKTPAK
jgi:thiol-disulfide isomerase/thioredoxin